jgi:DNA-binding response OmpR family regulator/HPt (histidine-containing phosphotransfer) domain-containing protein
MKILLVEDDNIFIQVLTKLLKAHHYTIDIARDGESGWNYGSSFEYDLMVLDVVLPKLDGISLCQRFRTEGYVTPILLLTAQNTHTAKVQGLDAGADDYVVKPYDRTELMARIRALLRRSSANPLPLLTCGGLMLNPSTCEVSYQGQQLTLTRKEYELLELMMRDSQSVFSTEELLEHLWTSEDFPSEATVRSHIRRVRQKLSAIGAPSDFIATVHGQGYYLKPPKTEMATGFTNALTNAHDQGGNWLNPTHTRLENVGVEQQQYLDFLNETWKTTKLSSLEQVAVLVQAVSDLQGNQLTRQRQRQAHQVVHKLAGTLGIFGLTQAVYLSRQLEYLLSHQTPLQSNQALLMQRLVLALHQEINRTIVIQCSPSPDGYSPQMLLISDDLEFNQSLGMIAFSRGIQLEVLPLLEVDAMLSAIETIATAGQEPHVSLLRFPERRSNGSNTDLGGEVPLPLQILQACTQRYPDLPLVVMGDRTDLNDRLAVVKCGGKLFLDRSASAEDIITPLLSQLKQLHISTKVMIVDDDDQWLRTLPTLLKPWGFKITTLAEPQEFWTVLQAIIPDVLVLDINMPQINGFELCQILRSDPQWQQLPVLFVSVRTDSASQQKAFSVGADDYLCKPLTGRELANRILSRLQRIRAWTH